MQPSVIFLSVQLTLIGFFCPPFAQVHSTQVYPKFGHVDEWGDSNQVGCDTSLGDVGMLLLMVLLSMVPCCFDSIERSPSGSFIAPPFTPYTRTFHQGGQANDVFGALTDDFMQDVVPAVDKLLNRNFPVTVYSGQVDLICTCPCAVMNPMYSFNLFVDGNFCGPCPHRFLFSNLELACMALSCLFVLMSLASHNPGATIGTEAWIRKLTWAGLPAWQAATKLPIYTDDTTNTKGFVKVSGKLSYFFILNAGHMVPGDAPDMAYKLLTMVTSGW